MYLPWMLTISVGSRAAPGPAWLSPPRVIPRALVQGCNKSICCSLVAAGHFEQSGDGFCMSSTLHPLGPGGLCCHLGTEESEDMSGFVLGLEGPSCLCSLTQSSDPGPGSAPSRGGSPKVPVCAPSVSPSLKWAAACACGLWGEHLQGDNLSQQE